MYKPPRSAAMFIGILAFATALREPTAFAAGADAASTPSHAGAAHARRPGRRKPATEAAVPGRRLNELRSKLQSEDPEEVAQALGAAKEAGRRAADLTASIERLLDQGLRPALVVSAFDALSTIGQPSSSASIRPYMHHRNAPLRIAAARALARIGGAESVAALRSALSDPARGVRSAAADALGKLRATEAAADLLVALDRGVFEAASALGQLCAAPDCEQLASRAGAIPFDVYAAGLDPILFRPSSEIPDDLKVRLIERVRDLGTADVHRYLEGVLSRWPTDGSARVRETLVQAVSSTGRSPS